MSRDVEAGAVHFERVVKEYRLGKPRAFLAAAWPGGTGVGRGQKLRALDDVSFGIEPGDAFALIGSNGAGKSTALKCLAQVIAPTHGSVRHGGRIVALIELGVGFHPDMTGLDNARFAAAMAGLRGAAARDVVDQAVEFSEIEKFINTPVKRYSSGMYARLSFGIAANLPAEILLVDEILAVGDLAFQRKCYEHLTKLRASEGKTLVFVSHADWVLKQTCRRAVWLQHGKVALEGPVGEVITAYHADATEQAKARGTLSMGGQRIRISEVQTARTLQMHGDIDVETSIDVADGVERPVIGVVVHDRHSRVVIASYSDESGVALGPGSHLLHIVLRDVPLFPGAYRLEVVVFERQSPQGEDSRKLDLTVEGTLQGDWDHGIVHVHADWSAVFSAP
jgi:ABC-type polysaccharide/polyol phosphate transport system ATPase subunit